jgi:hypothetical protein
MSELIDTLKSMLTSPVVIYLACVVLFQCEPGDRQKPCFIDMPFGEKTDPRTGVEIAPVLHPVLAQTILSDRALSRKPTMQLPLRIASRSTPAVRSKAQRRSCAHILRSVERLPTSVSARARGSANRLPPPKPSLHFDATKGIFHEWSTKMYPKFDVASQFPAAVR